jgi:hypothetical protein
LASLEDETTESLTARLLQVGQVGGGIHYGSDTGVMQAGCHWDPPPETIGARDTLDIK